MTSQYTDHAIKKSMVIGSEFCSVADAIASVTEEARDHELTVTVQESVIMVEHVGLEVYEEEGAFYLRIMEAWEL